MAVQGKSSKQRNNNYPARYALIEAAKEMFAQHGLSGTSIRDIANTAGLNSSLISYYFDGKEGLYRACLQQIGDNQLQMAQNTLRPPETEMQFRQRLQLFLENLFELYLADRNTGLIIIREYDRVNSPAEEIFKDKFLKVFELIVNFFRHAQHQGLVDRDKDSFAMASIFFGSLSSQMRLDHLKEKTFNRSIKDPAERELIEKHIIDLFLRK